MNQIYNNNNSIAEQFQYREQIHHYHHRQDDCKTNGIATKKRLSLFSADFVDYYYYYYYYYYYDRLDRLIEKENIDMSMLQQQQQQDYRQIFIDLLSNHRKNDSWNYLNDTNVFLLQSLQHTLLTSSSLNNETYATTTNNYCRNDMPGLYLIVQLLYIVVCISGLLGNTLVIYVVLRFSKMQTVTNMYIVNLAIADECFLIGIPFLIVTMNMQSWPFGEVLCKLYMATTSINQFTSSIFLLIMSADRYIAVCHPISAPTLRTPFISKVVSLSAWTLSAVLMIPVLMYSNTMTGENNTLSCNILWPDEEKISGHAAFTLYSSVLGFAIPLVLIFVFYSLVIRKLRTVGPKNKSKEKKKSHRKVTKLVLTVITVYVFCWLPYWVTQVALIFTPAKQCQPKLTIIVFLITGCLSYSNSAMNPILYAFLSDNFKKSFLKACTCAAGKDVNATLHLENSVFPKKHNRLGGGGGTAGGVGIVAGGGTSLKIMKTTKQRTIGAIYHRRGDADDFDEEHEGERGPLVSKTDTTVLTLSRSNTAINNDDTKDDNGSDSSGREIALVTKNGLAAQINNNCPQQQQRRQQTDL